MCVHCNECNNRRWKWRERGIYALCAASAAESARNRDRTWRGSDRVGVCDFRVDDLNVTIPRPFPEVNHMFPRDFAVFNPGLLVRFVVCCVGRKEEFSNY